MKFGYVSICWGQTYNLGLGIVGAPVGVTNVKDLYYVTNGPIDRALADIKAAGYDGVELFDGDVMAFVDRPDDLRKMMKNSGLELAGVYTGANLIYPDILPEELWKIEKVCAFAGKMGASNLVIGAGARRSTGVTDRDYDMLAQGLDQVAEIAEKYGMVASYHPHLSTAVETPEELEKVMSRSSKISFCPDTAHLAGGGGDVVPVVRKYVDRIRYIHLKDFIPDPFTFLPLGKGSLDLAGVMNVLRDHKYDGWVVVELDIYDGPAIEAAKISRNFLSKH